MGVRARFASIVLALGVGRGALPKPEQSADDRMEAALESIYYGVAAIGITVVLLALVAVAQFTGVLA